MTVTRGIGLAVLTAVGLVEVLGDGNGPVPIPDPEIEAVRRLVTSTLPVDPHPYLQAGDWVELIRGPLAGVQGILYMEPVLTYDLDIFVELPTAGSGLLSLSQVYDYLRAARLLRRRSAVERSLSGGCA